MSASTVGTVLLGAAALVEQLTTMIDRYAAGELSEDELVDVWSDINSRVAWSEQILAKAKQLRAERGL